MIQAAVKSAVGAYVWFISSPLSFLILPFLCSDKIALNVNADEAPVLGQSDLDY